MMFEYIFILFSFDIVHLENKKYFCILVFTRQNMLF